MPPGPAPPRTEDGRETRDGAAILPIRLLELVGVQPEMYTLQDVEV